MLKMHLIHVLLIIQKIRGNFYFFFFFLFLFFLDCISFRCWINLGEARLHQFKLDEGLNAYYEALKLGDHNAASRLLRAKGWSNSWQQFEEIIGILQSYAIGCSPDLQNSSYV